MQRIARPRDRVGAALVAALACAPFAPVGRVYFVVAQAAERGHAIKNNKLSPFFTNTIRPFMLKNLLPFALLLLSMGQAQAQIPLNAEDKIALDSLYSKGFIADTSTGGVTYTYLTQLPVLSNADALEYNDLGLSLDVDTANNEYRVVLVRLGGARADTADYASISTAALLPVFQGTRLDSLVDLHLYDNQIVGDVADMLPTSKRFERMQNFWVNNNDLTSIDAFINACVIDLGGGSLEGTLRTVFVDFNQLTSIPSALLENNPNLIDFNFGYNPLQQLPAPQGTCTVTLGSVSSTCPCYAGLGKIEHIKFPNQVGATSTLSGRFYPEHFLAKQLEIKAALGTPLPLEELIISDNQFTSVSPFLLDLALQVQSISSFLEQPNLTAVKMRGNYFNYSDFYAMNVALGVTASIQSNLGLGYEYAPQRDSLIGIGGVRRRGTGASLEFDLDIEDLAFRFRNSGTGASTNWGMVRYSYDWTWGNATETPFKIASCDQSFGIEQVNFSLVQASPTFSALGSNGISLSLNDLLDPAEVRVGVRTTAHALLDSSFIYHTISCTQFPAINFQARPKTIVFGECFDNAGNIIVCQEMTIQPNNSGRNEERDAAIRYLQDTLGARKTRDCMCGDVQLWTLPDNIELTANGAGTRSAIPSTRNKPGLRSADANYPLNTGNSITQPTTPSIDASQGSTDPNRTLIAIIDSGTDPDHPLLAQHIRANARETQNDDTDNDGNCLIDDILGFNFLDNNNVPYDDINHGTIVGSIAAGLSTPALSSTDSSVALLPIKFTNRFGQGSTFEAACGIYYAVDYHRNRSTGVRDEDSVRVINASWGYRGEFSHVLNDAIAYAGRRCGVLFVCAAGNDAQDMDNDDMGNYPAHFSLPNILVVAATDGAANLASYSNYGRLSAHIAAPGTFTNVAIPQEGLSPNTTTLPQSGTSFATPYVSRAAAILFNEYPAASAEAVKQALMSTATPLASADSSRLASGGVVNLNAALAYLDSMSAIGFCTNFIGVEELDEAEQQASSHILFPNPARENLQIAFTQEYTEATILLFDAKGSEISRQQARGETHISVSLANLPQGLYLVQVRTSGQTHTHKIVKID